MRVVILGCGTVGAAAGRLLEARGHAVTGVRRSALPPLVAGDAADPALWTRLGNQMTGAHGWRHERSSAAANRRARAHQCFTILHKAPICW